MNIVDELMVDIVNNINQSGILKHEDYLKLLEYGLYDSVSGLQNRHAFEKRLENIKHNKPKHVGIIFADTNALKYTNDNYGHRAGDSLIRKCAFLLRSYFGENDCYRISGDEFIITIENCCIEKFVREVSMFQEIIAKKKVPILSIGFSFSSDPESINYAIDIAEQNMHIDKYAFYKKFPEFKRQW